MDQKHQPQPEDTGWLDDLLEQPELARELTADDDAMAAAGLTDPVNLEVDQILAELAHSPGHVSKSAAEQEAPAAPQEETPAAQEAPPPAPPIFQDDAFRDTFGEGNDFRQIFDGIQSGQEPPAPEEAQPPQDEPEQPPQEEPVMAGKHDKKKKKGSGMFGIPHLLSTGIWLAIIVVVGVSIGRLAWICASDVLAFGRESREVTVVISESDTMDDIAAKLHRAGLIKYPNLFKLYADLSHAEQKISVGTFKLNTIYDYHALVSMMRAHAPSREEVKVSIPEGYTCAQIFQLLEENGVCTAADLEDYASDGELSEYWFLDGVERGSKYCLEGYLFPDTYYFYVNDTPKRVLEKFLNAFDKRFTEPMEAKFVTLNEFLSAQLAANGYDQDYIEQHQYTLREVVIVASMIQRESSGVEESYTISSVLYNRLTNPGAYPYLNVDAAIYYALGNDKTDPLTAEDLQIDSPYNTYTNPGLTPGPICNPSRASLDAALDPDQTDYYYYVFDPAAHCHRFSRTYEEHQATIAALKQQGQE